MQDTVAPPQFKIIEAQSESDWFTLADEISTPAERRFCLQHVLLLNRRHALARRALEELGPGPVRCPLLPYALAALENGREQEARRILETMVQVDPEAEMGWLALAATVESRSERRYCLDRALLLNGRNSLARRALARQGEGPARSPLLFSARAALEAGQRTEARAIVTNVLGLTPDAEEAWLLLAEVVATDPERRFCLQRVLHLNPDSAAAASALEALGSGLAWSPLENTVTLSAAADETPTPRWLAGARSFFSSKMALFAAVYLVAITAAELLTTTVAPRIGMTLHSVVLVILLAHTALSWGSAVCRFTLALTLAPLIRILSLSLPLLLFPLIYWYFIVSVPLFVATFVTIWTLGYRLADIGLNLRAGPLQMLVALTGLTLGVFEYSILRPDPLTAGPTLQDVWLPALILLFCTGFAEELIFRGIMQRAARAVLGWWGVVYVAIIFAVLHVGYHSVADVVFVFFVAMFFGLVTAYTRSILGVSLAHGLTNILLFLTLPFGKNPFDLLADLFARW